MPRPLRERIAETQSALVDAQRLDATLAQLVEEGVLSPERAAELRGALPEQLEDSRYVLRHLAAHLSIGAIFAFDLVPLPLGTIARVSWVAGSRGVESWRRNRERAQVHSLPVFLIAAIPWFGYAAYLLPLRRQSGELAFVLANQTWLSRTGRSYEQFLGDTRAPIRRLGRWLVPAPEADA